MNKSVKLTEDKNAYNTQRYDRLNIMIKKGMREVLKDRAKEHGMSLNKYVTNAIETFDPTVGGINYER